MNRLTLDFIDLLRKSPEIYGHDVEWMTEQVQKSRAIYKGKPVPFSYQPWLMTEEDRAIFAEIGERMMTIGKKTIAAYFADDRIRKLFNFPSWVEALILADNPLNGRIPMGRFDIFYGSQEKYQFCELNTDGSSAMNEDNELAEIWLNSKAAKALSNKWELSYFEMFDSWVETCLRLYGETGKSGLPHVAIMDFLDSATTEEFKRYEEAFHRRGCPVKIVDVRDLTYRDGVLYHEDFPIDLIYRRMVTFELIERPEGTEAFQQAYLQGAMLTVGPISTQIVHNKLFFAMLFETLLREYFTEEERQWIDQHIPFTAVVKEETKHQAMVEKDELIFKPMDKNASQGVVAGRDVDLAQWQRIIDAAIDSRDGLIQRFVEPCPRPYGFWRDGRWVREDYGSVLGMFFFDEVPAGYYTRLGKDTIISGLTDYYSIPHIIGRQRDDID